MFAGTQPKAFRCAQSFGVLVSVVTIRIGSNIASLNAQRRVAESTSQLSKTYERLSSGLRINHASDDAAGLAISSKLQADSRIAAQGIRNVNDGISLLSVAQGALSGLSAIATRQLELAEQAANGSYSTKQRIALNTEANALVKEFNRIVESTKFNNISLLDTSLQGLRVQAGSGTDGGITFNIGDALSRTAGNVQFASPGSSLNHVADNPNAVTIVDLDGDGILDMLVGGYSGSYPGTAAAFFKGRGNGTFNAAVSLGVIDPVGNFSVGDFNGDGRLDVMAGVNFVRNLGNGSFAAPVYAIDTGDYTSYVGDLDGNGVLDLVTKDYNSYSTTVWFGNGNGTFRVGQSYSTYSAPTDVVLQDVDNNGVLDMLVGGSGGELTARLGLGNGTFGAESVVFSGPGSPITNVSVGDLNNDGNLDAVVSNGNNQAFAMLGTGGGTFTNVRTYAANIGVIDALADIDSDGVLDLVTTSYGNGTAVRIGNGDGTFRSQVTVSNSSGGGYGIAFGDFNDDGAVDLVEGQIGAVNVRLANTKSVTTQAYLNITTQAGARNALTTIRATLNRITSEQGANGSMESRLSVALNHIATARENYDAAASRITDADLAEESANLVRRRIIQNAAVSVLAQANIQPSIALKLLK